MECIILAGGLGTRLHGVIGNYPKCMAKINGEPFLYYLFHYLEQQQCNRVILSLGYKQEIVIEWLSKQKRKFEIDYVIEHEPLGTGGGINLALAKAHDEHVIILNGDTMFCASLSELLSFHKEKAAFTTVALKKMFDFDRYGVVKINAADQIIQFKEKKYQDTGYINGGIYVVEKQSVFQRNLPTKYSFEKDYLEAFIKEQQFYGFKSTAYFIDIGIPEDYDKAQKDFKELFV